ncbi:hypothetical protein ACF0H5_008536 [Mactra antiquata]
MWKLFSILLLGVCLSVSPGLPLDEYDTQIPGHFLNTFLIEVDNADTAARVAQDNGFRVLRQIPQLDLYLLEHPEVTGRSKRSADDYVVKLKQDSRVKFAEQQITLKRVKRNHEVIHDKQLEFPIPDITDNSKYYRVIDRFDTRDNLGPTFNDEYYRDQWYLVNTGQTGGEEGNDINILPAWSMGYDGRGVVVTILDDGIDHEHPDIKRNYDPEASADMNDASDKENDPEPDKLDKRGNSHGTRCAGEIAAEANNGICGVGVAPRTSIGGIRILDGPISDELEARALLYNNQHIDIYSASWGPRDDGLTMEGPKRACTEALKRGVATGRGGKGSIYVWATGNGGQYGDTCGADGYVSQPESISVQSLTDKGEKPFFGEICASTMISVPTGGESTQEEEIEAQYKIKVVTTDVNDGCIENFEGTSSAAPIATGCYSLVLQANCDLSWRDVQHITASSARIPSVDDSWIINGAGYHVNSKFGFGLMDCSRMVELAQNWKLVPEQHVCETQPIQLNEEIGSSQCFKYRFNFNGCHDDRDRRINSMEHVQLALQAKSGRRGNVEIYLTSPAGTRSEMLRSRPEDDSNEDIDFTFMTVHNWGEDSIGEWTLEVCDNTGVDNVNAGNTIYLRSVSMIVSGYYSNNKTPDKRSKQPTTEELLEKKSDEFKRSRESVIKRAKDGHSRTESDEEREAKDYAASVDDILSQIGHIFDSRSFNNKLSSSNSRFNDKNVFGKRGEHFDSIYEGKKDNSVSNSMEEILEILRELDNSKSSKDFIRSYYEHRREIERKRKIQALISEIEEFLKNEK